MSENNTGLFDPVECASLHNQLVQRAVQAKPSLQPTQDVLRTYSIEDPLRARLTRDTQTFLSAIDSWPVQDEDTALTPFCQPPSPTSFFQYRLWPQISPYEDELILLYQDVSFTLVNEGGLFFDQARELACWIEPSLGFPPDNSWFPLAEVLGRWLQMWDVGKITADFNRSLRNWGQWEMQQALTAWDELVKAIEERMPPIAEAEVQQRSSSSSATLVDQIIADQWADHPFERVFLASARAPMKPGLHVAPGVKAWTTQSFQIAHANEPTDSERRLTIGTQPTDDPARPSHRAGNLAPALLFPSDATVPTRASRSVDNFWGRGSVLLERRAGLYLYPYDEWGDAVLFVNGGGGDTLFAYRNGWCPWLRVRPLATVREVLRFWTVLVVEGVWRVDKDGVVGGAGYFDGLDAGKKVVDVGGTMIEVDFRADWEGAPAF